MAIVGLVDVHPAVPAILDPNFNQAVDNSNTQDFVGKLFTNTGFENLNQRELQFIRHILKGYINVLSNEVEFCKRGAHVLHEASDVNDPSTEKYFKAHSKYRARLVDARRHLRKLETIQRKIRLLISNG